jgi:hypothetical protein
MNQVLRARGVLGPLLLVLACAPAPAGAEDRVQFNRDIRPILSENCYFCHGPDRKHRDSGLRLDIREEAVGKEAIVPGKPDESELYLRVTSDDDLERMPPKKANKHLTAAQKELLGRWIAEGAEYQPHWAYVVPERPTVTAVKRREWVQNPVDAFILRRLEDRKLAPSREADRRTLLRRLSLDLVGLPPTPEEVARFLADDDPRAYERQLDRLLESPHYGERMAVPWLDLVRFSDTVGYHGDQNQRIFPYRDYVIAAFNANKPFDVFTIEQLAGDLLPDPTVEQRVATGFNRLNMMTREGGAQPKEYLAKYAADRVRTLATTWLGSTLGCAECHDHKFDPFTTRDFYRLEAFFADVKQWGVYSDYGYTPNPELKGWTNDYPFPPEIEVASPYLAQRQESVVQQMRAHLAAASSAIDPEAFAAWTEAARGFLGRAPSGWARPSVIVESVTAPAAAARNARAPRKKAAAKGASAEAVVEVVAQDDQCLLLSGKKARADRHRFRLTPGPGWVAAIRLEVLPHAAHKGKVTRDGAASTLIQLSAALDRAGEDGDKETPLPFAQAEADHSDPRYSSTAPLIGVRTGWKTSSQHPGAPQTAVWWLERPVLLAEGDQVVVTLRSENVGCVRVALSPFGALDPRRIEVDPSLIAALRADPASRTPEELRRLQAAYLAGTGSNAAVLAKLQALQTELLECRDGRAFTQVTLAMEPLVTRVLPRGNWQDESGDVVAPGIPEFLSHASSSAGESASEGRRLTRLDLARWIVAHDNPLTARVFMNRLWRQFFGTGLSSVLDDVGAQGESPTHPELLDWLAVEFRDSGWNVKRMVKILVMSAAYRQDSRQRPELRTVDPGNRLVAAQSPRRLEAEFVRDNALAIAGLINLDTGGPSAHPYQPADYYANLQFPDRDYLADRDPRQYRRGVYMHWQRTFLHPMLANFDAPSREECTAVRTVANTPQQALTLLNDPTFVEAARVLAESLLAQGLGSDGARLEALYLRALARPPRAAERTSLLDFLGRMRRAYEESPEDARKLLAAGIATPPRGFVPTGKEVEAAAWTSVCRVVLNLQETITRY